MITRPAVINVISTQPGTSPRSVRNRFRCSRFALQQISQCIHGGFPSRCAHLGALISVRSEPELEDEEARENREDDGQRRGSGTPEAPSWRPPSCLRSPAVVVGLVTGILSLGAQHVGERGAAFERPGDLVDAAGQRRNPQPVGQRGEGRGQWQPGVHRGGTANSSAASSPRPIRATRRSASRMPSPAEDSASGIPARWAARWPSAEAGPGPSAAARGRAAGCRPPRRPRAPPVAAGRLLRTGTGRIGEQAAPTPQIAATSCRDRNPSTVSDDPPAAAVRDRCAAAEHPPEQRPATGEQRGDQHPEQRQRVGRTTGEQFPCARRRHRSDTGRHPVDEPRPAQSGRHAHQRPQADAQRRAADQAPRLNAGSLEPPPLLGQPAEREHQPVGDDD